MVLTGPYPSFVSFLMDPLRFRPSVVGPKRPASWLPRAEEAVVGNSWLTKRNQNQELPKVMVSDGYQ